jgi:hypothetical protein
MAIGACSSAQPRGKEVSTDPDAADPEPTEPIDPPTRRDAARTGNEPAAMPADAAAPTPPPDAAPPEVDAVAGPGPEPGPDAADSPPAPSACPALTQGWESYQPGKSLQFEGGGTTEGITSLPEGAMHMDAHCLYTNKDGIELFKMTKNPAGVRQRCEMRVKNGYRTGIQQFEGDLRVTQGDGTCVHQVFKFLMLVAYPKNGGELHQHSQTFLASGIFGKWVHVNTVHDTAAGKVDIYLDCVKKLTIPQSQPDAADGWYHKYGVYNLGGSFAQSEWRNVRFYHR